MKGSLWDAISDLGEGAVLHRYEGYVSTGGHHSHVFGDAETVELVIRPWEADMGRQSDAGYTGQTSGKKIYADGDLGLKRDDRIVYRGGHFRLMNPQYDQTFELERWDGQLDERNFRLRSDIDLPDSDIEPPDNDGYGGY